MTRNPQPLCLRSLRDSNPVRLYEGSEGGKKDGLGGEWGGGCLSAIFIPKCPWQVASLALAILFCLSDRRQQAHLVWPAEQSRLAPKIFHAVTSI